MNRKDNVYLFQGKSIGTSGGGGEPPMNIEARVAKLENDIGEIKRHYATREDLLKLELKVQEGFTGIKDEMGKNHGGLQKQIADQTKWMAGLMISIAGITLAIAKFLL